MFRGRYHLLSDAGKRFMDLLKPMSEGRLTVDQNRCISEADVKLPSLGDVGSGILKAVQAGNHLNGAFVGLDLATTETAAREYDKCIASRPTQSPPAADIPEP